MNPTENCKTCKYRSIIQNGSCELVKVRGCVKPAEIKRCTCDMRTLLARGCLCGGQ